MRGMRCRHPALVLLAILAFSVSGCSGKQDNSAEQNRTTAVESGAEQALGSNQESTPDAASILAEVDATDPHRKATVNKEEQAEEFVVCSMCGQKVLKQMAVYLDGKLVCAHCVPGTHDSDPDAKGDREQPQTP